MKELKGEIAELKAERRENLRARLFHWLTRNALGAILYYALWNVEWFRWTLFVYVPLTTAYLITLLAMDRMLAKRIARLEKATRDL